MDKYQSVEGRADSKNRRDRKSSSVSGDVPSRYTAHSRAKFLCKILQAAKEYDGNKCDSGIG